MPWTGRRVGRFLVAVVVVVGAGVAGACGDDGPSAGERAVCDSLQRMVHDLENGERTAALEELARLDDLVDGSGNETMVAAGVRFFDAISEPVDYGSMTVDESIALADRVFEESVEGIDALGAECDRLGLTVEADRAKLDAQGPN